MDGCEGTVPTASCTRLLAALAIMVHGCWRFYEAGSLEQADERASNNNHNEAKIDGHDVWHSRTDRTDEM